MITAVYLIISLTAFAVLIWGVRLFRQSKDVIFLLILAPLMLLWYDSFIIGIGSWIGEGTTLKTLSWPRYIAHGLLLPFWIIAAGAIARRAKFSWAQSKWAMGVFCIIATGGIALGVKELLGLELYPACLQGTLRYVPYIGDGQACRASMAGLGHAPSGPPVIPILSTLIFIGLGAGLWIRRKWAWLFLGSVFMFVMAGMPQSMAGPLLSNLAEPVIAFTVLLTARRFTSGHDVNL